MVTVKKLKSLIPTFRRQKQVDLCKRKTSLVYRVLGQPELHREKAFLQKTKTNKN